QFWPASSPQGWQAKPMPPSSVQMFAVEVCRGDGEQSSPSGWEQNLADDGPSGAPPSTAPHSPGSSPSPTTGSNEIASLPSQSAGPATDAHGWPAACPCGL